jgi:putative oxidoreductase
MKAPFLIGRLIFGGFFLYSGINHLSNRKALAGYAQSKGVPTAELAVSLSAVPLLIGGSSLLLGVNPKLGALAILAFLAAVSPVMHDFWRNQDPNERTNNLVNFMKNAALAGGALALMGVDEPWEASVPVAQPGLIRKLRAAARRMAA